MLYQILLGTTDDRCFCAPTISFMCSHDPTASKALSKIKVQITKYFMSIEILYRLFL